MSSIYRVFIRHEMESQPTYFKYASTKTHDELLADIYETMSQPAPSLLEFTDLDGARWIFRADKIYTVYIKPPEVVEEEVVEEEVVEEEVVEEVEGQ